jgi:hemin uptake protein HemP
MTNMRLNRDGALEINEGLPVHYAEELTKGGTQARIVLGDQIYSLRITRAGKLILTK